MKTLYHYTRTQNVIEILQSGALVPKVDGAKNNRNRAGIKEPPSLWLTTVINGMAL